MIILYQGDCLDILPTLENKVDAIITDIPYGTTACSWDTVISLEDMWREVKRVLKTNGVFVTTASQPFTSVLVCSNLEWFKYEWIWEKGKATGFLSVNKTPMKAHENIIVFSKGGCTYNPQMKTGKKHKSGRKKTKQFSEVYGEIKDNLYERNNYYPRSVFYTKHEHDSLHPTQKPVALYEYLIKTYTNENETVLDITMGSGTTAIACIKTGRNFIGIEKEEKYFDIAVNRIKAENSQLSMFVPHHEITIIK